MGLFAFYGRLFMPLSESDTHTDTGHRFYQDILTEEISLWKALKQSWMPPDCGYGQVSVVFQKNLLTTETFLIIVELTNIS